MMLHGEYTMVFPDRPASRSLSMRMVFLYDKTIAYNTFMKRAENPRRHNQSTQGSVRLMHFID